MAPRACTARFGKPNQARLCTEFPGQTGPPTFPSIWGKLQAVRSLFKRCCLQVIGWGTQLFVRFGLVLWSGTLKTVFTLRRASNEFPRLGKAEHLALRPARLFVVLTQVNLLPRFPG